MEARFRPQIQAPHECQPLGTLEYPIGWIEGPDYEDQHGRGQCEEADQCSKPKHIHRGLDTGSSQRVGREEAQVQLGLTEPWMRRGGSWRDGVCEGGVQRGGRRGGRGAVVGRGQLGGARTK